MGDSAARSLLVGFITVANMASDPYGAIKFGEFRKYMQHKKAKLKDQEMELYVNDQCDQTKDDSGTHVSVGTTRAFQIVIVYLKAFLSI